MVQRQLEYCDECEAGKHFNKLLRLCIDLEEVIIHCKKYSLYNASVCLLCEENYYLIDGSCESLSVIDNCHKYDSYNNCLGIVTRVPA